MTRAVHQLLSDFAFGDAMGVITLQTQTMLRELGFESEIYADVIDPRLRDRCRPAAQLEREARDGDAVIYQMGIGSPVAYLFARHRGPRIIMYHNITPPAYFRDTNPRVAARLVQGREQLAVLVPRVELCAGVSRFNVEEMRLLGARRTAVVPPVADLQHLDPRPSQPQTPPLLLFVSRVAPNKRHDDLIRTLAALRATAQPDARLAIVGRFTDTEDYVDSLRALATGLGVDGAVEWTGRLGNQQVGDLYARAAVFVSASEHEGFSLPLLEAMAFGVPVVAYAAGAVPDTLDGAGVLLRHKDPLVWAAVVDRAIRDGRLRATLATEARRRLRDFTPDTVRHALSNALASIDVVPQEVTA
jgi:glycosyltransferase involved in cell wall biosynthesis